ncbi:MAG TPA: DnaJ domain-containing protein [Polyangiaceae bacterium]|nr:DnaJ domain-containing protein [Polyangiaceae bacterium]
MTTELVRIPRLVAGVDIRALPLAPAEAFVLSRIDGVSSDAEIALATALELAMVEQVLTHLSELGAIELQDQARPPKAAPVRRPRASTSGPWATEELIAPRAQTQARSRAPTELDEVVDLDEAKKRQILDFYQRLEAATYYELLNVDPSADRRAIKAKFYEIINLYHPDRFYGKKLGSFKNKLERIFQCVSDAHDVLTRAEARAEYDAYLQAEQSTRVLEEQLHDEEAYARELDAVNARIAAEAEGHPSQPVARESQPSAPLHISSAPPLSARPLSTPPVIQSSMPPGVSAVRNVSAPPPATGSLPPPTASSDPAPARGDPEARRRALARKLGLSSPPPERRSVPAPAIPRDPMPRDPAQARDFAGQELKRRYEQRMLDARRRQIEEYTSRADAALAERKLVEAVNALRIAVSLAPQDPTLRQRLDDLQSEAGRELSDRYLEQARYEEREQRWAEAVRSYMRALSGKPNPRLHERTAHCLLAAQGDVKQAVEHARKAVLQVPNEPRFRVTLGRAYYAANMRESAIGELERAASLAPTDDTIKDLLRRARRGEI